MKNDFMVAIHQVCHERQLPLDTVLEAVEVALISAYKRNYAGNHSITAQINQKSGAPQIFVEKVVVNNVTDENNEISLVDAQEIVEHATIGSLVSIENTPKHFGRIAAQTAKQVILQRIREAERDALYKTYADREGEIINGTVHKVDPHQVILTLGNIEAVLPRAEQIPTERYSEGQRLRAYVSSVAKSSRGPQIIISRTHRTMLRRLLEVEVPEIYNGTVEIKSIAREAGYRSKVAVAALQEGVDPVGSCVGMRGTRIQNIVNELGGEKIDVVQWNVEIGYFIANSLSPAKVTNVMLYDEKGKTAVVVVPDKQLSLAIGKEGQNARLAAKLTGWRIDIKSVYEAVTEALTKIKKDPEIRERVSHRMEIFNMGKAIQEDKDPLTYTEPELKLLSEAIEIVNIAELTAKREKKAKVLADIQATKASGDEVDLLAHAEALLTGKSPDEVRAEQSTADEMADSLLDELAMGLLLEDDDDATSLLDMAAESAETLVKEETVSESVKITEPEKQETSTKPEAPPVDADLMAKAEALLTDTKVKPASDVSTEEDESDIERERVKKKAKQKKRRLVFDEELGEMVAQRRRKGNRKDQNWHDYED
ncbi:transcription termination factor NusA [Anaerolineales bacterium HSG6]|nr:transcription termination factor NusA [Anaerolineales bacterium HSG6]MDM8533011.1 transcription termination factor NusA [Anaerolineales bacterium HSG25]